MSDSHGNAAGGLAPATRPGDLMPAPASDAHRYHRTERVEADMLGEWWLAEDLLLQRQVWVRMVPMPPLSPSDWGRRLHRLQELEHSHHPCWVPLVDVTQSPEGVELVYEPPKGVKLSQWLGRGPMTPAQAARCMLDLLSALCALHDVGMPHGQLDPDLIYVHEDRAYLTRCGEGLLASEPWDDDPEHFRQACEGDVRSAAYCWWAMTAGAAALTPGARQRWIAGNEFVTDEELGEHEGLRVALRRALDRRPGEGYLEARGLQAAVETWLQNHGAEFGMVMAASGHPVLDALLAKMKAGQDFPALTSSITRIQRIAQSETESLSVLSNEVLKDVALTHKLLRVVNSARFGQAGGNITTVSRALALIGFAGVRNLALSLILMEHLRDRGQVKGMQDEFLFSLLAAHLARELSGIHARPSEEVYLAALLQNLGLMLARYYFPSETAKVLERAGSRRQYWVEQRLSAQVLGLSFCELGFGVAQMWGLPEPLLESTRRTAQDPQGRVLPHAQMSAALASLANEMVEGLYNEGSQWPVGDLLRRYVRVLPLAEDDVRAALGRAQAQVLELVQTLGESHWPERWLAVLRSVVLHQGDGSSKPQLGAEQEPRPSTWAQLEEHRLKPFAPPGDASGEGARVLASEDVLSAGIQEISASLVEGCRLNELLRMALETLYRAMRFQRIAFCLVNPKTGELTGRMGLGEGPPQWPQAIRIAPRQGQDIASVICLKGMDSVINDLHGIKLQDKVPGWLRGLPDVGAFVMLPVKVQGHTVALIYADQAGKGGIQWSEREWALVRTLRNQVIMALRQTA
ncbi:MAG: HDOD domain-containing protein [Burkholderiaceae bacterium]|nr:MAG: HDOD domain-containing protein [Burkholderiaceae bacterium]